jgi:hypothetical protein
MEPLSFLEAVEKLSRFNIKQHNIYFIDLILLCEMAWAAGRIQSAERDILLHYLNHHVNSINRLAGCTIVKKKDAKDFACKFLDKRPDPQLCETIRAVMPAIRIDNKEPNQAERTRLDILNACLDIAASSVTEYPYGLRERFTEEEKDYYHHIEKILMGTPSNQ